MLNTVLFDMGGTLEDIWNNQETQAKAMDALQKTLRAHGLEPGCSPEEFDRRVMAGLKEYKRWSEGLELEKKPEEIWPDYYLKEFGFNREKLIPITEELANLWEVTYYHRELRGDVLETLEALKARGYHIGIISNNASHYNAGGVRHPGLHGGCDGFQRDRLPQAPSGDFPHFSAADADQCRKLRVCGRYDLP